MISAADLWWGALSALLGVVVPKDPELFVFTGRQYGGNTAPLFERAEEFGVRAIWLSKRDDVVARGRPNVLSTRSLRGLWAAARAGAVVLTHSLGDLGPLLLPSRRTRLINVYHGMPIKRVSRADPAFFARRHARRDVAEMARYECMIATSAATAKMFADTFGLPTERVYVTGQPRTDALFAAPGEDFAARYAPPLPPHRRRVLYCPTWREGSATSLFPFADRDDQALDALLERLDAVLFVRTHPNDPGRLQQRRTRVVPMQGDIVEEVTDVLPRFDVLITDYSSVYYDFLLLDRPTIFLPYDLAEYARSPGFYLPFSQIVAGPTPATAAEFHAALEQALAEPAAHAAERKRVQRLIYDYVDAGATERVLARITRPTARR